MALSTLSSALLGFFIITVSAAPTKKDPDINIYSFHINSTVNSRYATTVITSRVANRLTESKEIHFQVKIPKNAFISRFRMTMEGKTYDGVVKQKEEAQQQYSQAVSRGESAGIVSSVGRTLEDFKTSVTVSALSKVTFELTYEELLKRRLGKYELLINTQPTQPVADFKIEVYINEAPGISLLEVKGKLNKDLPNAVSTTQSGKEVWVNFNPTREQQTTCTGCENGLDGDLIISYDVERPDPKGELQASKNYFVHYFSPTDVQRIPKNVVFIIDRSGSMHGRKMTQTRLAMLKILGDLKSDDTFGLITFDSQIDVWKPELLQASERNLQLAKSFVNQIQDRGSTDINAAVLKGVEMIKRHPRERSASILILLTDGDPTSGVTDIRRIQANVKEAVGGKFPLYCLGFGFDVNFEFLEKMALENNGLARRIYEDSDADVQLKDFYEEVATPLLTDVQLNYIGVSNLTQTSFSHYYNGSEIVVAGEITDNNLEMFNIEVLAISKSKNVKYEDSTSLKDLIQASLPSEKLVERLWAYLTVKQLLEKEVTLKGEDKEEVKKRALDLSLKYQFVTPLTSMVVTKPEGEKTQVAHKPKEGEQTDTAARVSHHPGIPGTPGQPGMMGPPGHPGMISYSAHPGFYGPARHPVMSGAAVYPGMSGPPSQPDTYGQFVPAAGFLPNRGGAAAGALPGGGGAAAGLLPNRGGAADDMFVGVHAEADLGYYDYQSPDAEVVHQPRPTQISSGQIPSFPLPAATHSSLPVKAVRFLLSSSSAQMRSLCYDVPVGSKLRLLQDSSSAFSMNGELTQYGTKGFKQISLHYKSDHHLIFSLTDILYSDSQTVQRFTWDQQPTRHQTDSVTLVLRRGKMDVTMGSVRIIILLHNKDGEQFLWPVVHQKPKDCQGILGKADVQYEELPQSEIKIKDMQVKTVLSSAIDYRLSTAPSVQCWLVPARFALQGELSDFTVSQL